jgi:signal transduction histidine kinase
MEEKVAAFGFFLQPETITATSSPFRLHGAVTKYRKIYQRSYQSKDVTLDLAGTSFAYVTWNAEALTIIPHALIDNAVKYAPRGSRIDITFEEDDHSVTLKVASFGPKIEPSEQRRIFEPFFRGTAASQSGEEGMGFGLAFAEVVARSYGETIQVRQDTAKTYESHYWTEFICTFAKASEDDEATGRRRSGRRGQV